MDLFVALRLQPSRLRRPSLSDVRQLRRPVEHDEPYVDVTPRLGDGVNIKHEECAI